MSTANTKPKARKPAGAATEGLKVTARSPQGIRRAGRHWAAEVTIVPLSELTEDELEQLENEPGLVTARVPIEPEAKAKA